MSADDPVLYELRDSGVAVLTLNRPERMNGWGGGLAAKFYACSTGRGRPGRAGDRRHRRGPGVLRRRRHG